MDICENNDSKKFLVPSNYFPFPYLGDSQEPNYSIDDKSLLVNEISEDEHVSLYNIIEIPKFQSDAIQNIKNSISKSPKFEIHYCFNPKLKNNEKDIINKKLPIFLTTTKNSKRKRRMHNKTRRLR